MSKLILHRKVEPKDNINSIFMEAICSMKRGYNLFVAFFDANNMKAINDTYGHLMGDNVISKLSFLLGTNIRDEDRLIRFGGDEFLLILPNMKREDIRGFITRIQQAVSENKFLIGKVGGLTVSAGVVEYNPLTHKSPAMIIEEADKLMYAAKQNAPHYLVTSSDDQKRIDAVKEDKRGNDPASTRRRHLFGSIFRVVKTEHPEFDITQLLNIMRNLWGIGQGKIETMSWNQLADLVIKAYEKKYNQAS